MKIGLFLSIFSVGNAMLVSEDIGHFNGSCNHLGESFLQSQSIQQLLSHPTSSAISLMELAASLPQLNLENYITNSRLSIDNPSIVNIKQKLVEIFIPDPDQTASGEVSKQVNDLYTSTVDEVGFQGFFMALGEAMRTTLGVEIGTSEKDFIFVTAKSRRVRC